MVGLPLTWYLASPLVIRSTLIEPPTAAVADSSPSAPGASIGAPKTTPAPVAFEPVVAAAGTFHGADDFHFGQGTASIIETSPGRFTLRFEDFSVRNGPDLYVYLSPSVRGLRDGALELGTLKATDGAFGYELPEGTDPAEFASAVIWCKQFAVQFAVAPLAAG